MKNTNVLLRIFHATKQKYYPIEIISFIYMAITAVFIICFKQHIKDCMVNNLLLIRLGLTGIIYALFFWNQCCNIPLIKTLRQILPLIFIIHFYPETYYFNTCIFSEYLDDKLIAADQWLFGCQPSTLFSEVVPCAWFNELMNFAYVSYFFVISIIVIYLIFHNEQNAYRAAFVLLFSFFVYYLLFIILPAAGPQFHVFEHDHALPAYGPMRKVLLFFHSMGEQPTGAVPSSHIGIMLIYMILLWKNGRKLFWWIAPLSLLLALSTVYIRAHYAIDVLLGFASAPFIYWLGNRCWQRMTNAS